MSYGMEWWQMAILLAFGIFCLSIFKWAWNYKSKSQKREEKRMKGSKWERSHYNTVLLPKARWEEPPDDEVWRN